MRQDDHSDSLHYPDPHHDLYSKTVFGFWIYLLTDFMLFATLFATYSVLQAGTYGGPSSRDLYQPTLLFIESVILLTCSFTAGLAGAVLHRKERRATLILFTLTCLLGILFFILEGNHLVELVNQGNSWKKSAFLSAFFTLYATLILHLILAILWTLVLMVPVYKEGVTASSITRLSCLRMFWQFLSLIWTLMFIIIYLI